MAQLRVVQCEHISMFCDQLFQAAELMVCESALFKCQHIKQLLYSLSQWTRYLMNFCMQGFSLSPVILLDDFWVCNGFIIVRVSGSNDRLIRYTTLLQQCAVYGRNSSHTVTWF